jgi:hypothetical protein
MYVHEFVRWPPSARLPLIRLQHGR